MGEQRNLTEENVSELKKHLEEMSKTNPDLSYRFFRQQDENPIEPFEHETQDDQPSNMKIFERLEAIERRLDLIFGGHVLIRGKFETPQIKGIGSSLVGTDKTTGDPNNK